VKYVFLDIDGVLNSAEFMEREKPQEQFKGVDEVSNYDHSVVMLDRTAVERLNGLVVPGVAFVISSTWRILHPLHHIQRMLRSKGFDGSIIGATPVSIGKRGREIGSWLMAATGTRMNRSEVNSWPEFVILDDDSDMLTLGGYLVQTDNGKGLQDDDIELAKNILNLGKDDE